jgi:hypothetical protein
MSLWGDIAGKVISAGAEAFGADEDDVTGFFDKAGSVAKSFGVDTDDVFSSASKLLGGDATDALSKAGNVFGIDADDVKSVVGGYMGGTGTDGSDAGGGFGGVLKGLIGDGDGGDAGGGAGGGAWGSVLSAVGGAVMHEAPDLPFVKDLAGGDWASLAGSVPGLHGAMSSLGVTQAGVDGHSIAVAGQTVDEGSAWSFGSALLNRGTQFLHQVAEPVGGHDVFGSVTGIADQAGIQLPAWAADLGQGKVPDDAAHSLNPYVNQATHVVNDVDELRSYIQDPAAAAQAHVASQMDDLQASAGVHAAQDTHVDARIDTTTGEHLATTPEAHQLDTFNTQPAQVDAMAGVESHDAFAAAPVEHAAVEQDVDVAPPPPVEEAPPPADLGADATDQLEQDLNAMGDEAY